MGCVGNEILTHTLGSLEPRHIVEESEDAAKAGLLEWNEAGLDESRPSRAQLELDPLGLSEIPCLFRGLKQFWLSNDFGKKPSDRR